MSNGDDTSTEGAEGTAEGIDDEQLPDDLQPGEDNPLAEPLDDDVDPDDLDMDGGKPAEQWDDEDLED